MLLRTIIRISAFNNISRHFKNVSTTNVHLIARNSISAPSAASTIIKDDFDTIQEIESNLFENIDNSHKPVDANKLLKNYKKQKKVKKFEYKNKTEVITIKPPKEKSQIIKDTDLNLEYIKLSLNDPMLSKLLLTAKSKKRRDQKEQIIVEGRKLILEAIKNGFHLQLLLFSQKEQVALIKDTIRDLKDIKIIRVPHHNLKFWSTLTTCPGLLAVFDRPNNYASAIELDRFPISVICDNIREPNNLGSIIRTAAAIPCEQVIVLKGCCDPWETKALRGGCGGQFRIGIKDDVTWDIVYDYLPKDFSVIIAESNINQFHNTAVIPYMNMEPSNDHNVLVIGGETHGISEEAYGFLKSNKIGGSCVHIPLAEGIESLNTASALTLLLFEMRKKIMEQKFNMREENIT